MSEHRHGSAECREIFARLSEYLDQELDPELCEAVERHNAGCAPCEAFLKSLRTTIELIGDQPAPRLSDDQRREILDGYEALKDSADERDRD